MVPVLQLTQDRIQNPLAGFSTGELMADVEDFARSGNLMDILPELKKGALVARDPANFQSLPDLDEEEKAALAREVTHRWSQTTTLYLTIITCSIGAAVQGWDQTGSNGANLSFPQAFGIGNGGSKLSQESCKSEAEDTFGVLGVRAPSVLHANVSIKPTNQTQKETTGSSV